MGIISLWCHRLWRLLYSALASFSVSPCTRHHPRCNVLTNYSECYQTTNKSYHKSSIFATWKTKPPNSYNWLLKSLSERRINRYAQIVSICQGLAALWAHTNLKKWMTVFSANPCRSASSPWRAVALPGLQPKGWVQREEASALTNVTSWVCAAMPGLGT